MIETPQSRYDAANTERVQLKLSKKYDLDILDWLAAQPKESGGKQGAIKALIRKEIKMKKDIAHYDEDLIRRSIRIHFVALGLPHDAHRGPYGGCTPVQSIAVQAMTVPDKCAEYFAVTSVDGWNGYIEFKGIETGYRVRLHIDELFG